MTAWWHVGGSQLPLPACTKFFVDQTNENMAGQLLGCGASAATVLLRCWFGGQLFGCLRLHASAAPVPQLGPLVQCCHSGFQPPSVQAALLVMRVPVLTLDLLLKQPTPPVSVAAMACQPVLRCRHRSACTPALPAVLLMLSSHLQLGVGVSLWNCG